MHVATRRAVPFDELVGEPSQPRVLLYLRELEGGELGGERSLLLRGRVVADERYEPLLFVANVRARAREVVRGVALERLAIGGAPGMGLVREILEWPEQIAFQGVRTQELAHERSALARALGEQRPEVDLFFAGVMGPVDEAVEQDQEAGELWACVAARAHDLGDRGLERVEDPQDQPMLVAQSGRGCHSEPEP